MALRLKKLKTVSRVMVDTGFWHALFNREDQYHEKAVSLLPYLENGEILVPFPTMYETINTKLLKRKDRTSALKDVLSKDNVEYIHDDEYRKDAINLTFDYCLNKNRQLSLVDTIIRLMLDDVNVRIKYLISFNVRDFVDVCHKRNIQIISE